VVLIETIVSPFHCFYQDALFFHSQSHRKLAQSESEASRLARAALLLYLESAEALLRQAAVELGRPELSRIVTDPSRPLPLAEAWRLLPAITGEGSGCSGDLSAPPWPQFAELLALRVTWAYPGAASDRRVYYAAERPDAPYEPIEPHRVPPGVDLPVDRLVFPLTGLPRDPYALRPRHLDTARSVLDAAIEALDRRLGGALTRDGRHRKEPIRIVDPASLPTA
jgi:hypothetical protein